MAKRYTVNGGTGKLVADCPCCKDWSSDTRGRVVLCKLADGLTHAAPEMWVASRAGRIEREHGLDGIESYFAAWRDWAVQCELQARFDAERAGVVVEAPAPEVAVPAFIAAAENKRARRERKADVERRGRKAG